MYYTKAGIYDLLFEWHTWGSTLYMQHVVLQILPEDIIHAPSVVANNGVLADCPKCFSHFVPSAEREVVDPSLYSSFRIMPRDRFNNPLQKNAEVFIVRVLKPPESGRLAADAQGDEWIGPTEAQMNKITYTRVVDMM